MEKIRSRVFLALGTIPGYNGAITERKRKETVKRFLLGILTAVMTLAVILGAGFVLAEREKEKLPLPAETLPEVTEISVPTEPETETVLPAETTIPVVQEKQVIDRVPLYYQTDYPHTKFGSGTIATSGCSVTCLAMVATYLTDLEYTPPQMAYHFGKYGKTHVDRLNYGIEQMQLPCQQAKDIQEVIQALRDGKVAIAMMNELSEFTDEQHFIVLAGVNEAGRIIVNDPMETNYIRADTNIRDGYDNGFEEHYLYRGFSGAWLFDKKDMPEEPFLYDASMPEQRENRYKGYVLSEEDIYTLACFVYAEARNEPAEAKQAVAEVVLNRMIAEDYPNTVHKVIYQTELHRAVNTMKYVEEPGLDQYIAVDTAMYGPYVLPEDICFYSAWQKGTDVWGQLGSLTFAKKG